MKLFSLLMTLLLFAGRIVGQSYDELVDKSFDYLDNAEWAAAEACLKKALHQEPANPRNYLLLTNLGTIQQRQGKLEDALLSYTTALSRNPKSTVLLENRASLYVEMNQVEKAKNDYDVLLILDPLNQSALYNRGLLYLQDKNFTWAEADFNKLLEINEKSLLARMGYAMLEKLRGNYQDAERIYNYLISVQPNNYDLYFGRAETYFMMGKNSRANADLNKIFVESKPVAAHYLLRAKIKIAQYENASALKDLDTALEKGADKSVIDELKKLINK